MKKMFLRVAIVFAMFIVFGLPGIAQAGEFNRCDACAKKINGQLRLVSNPNECLNSEEYVNLCDSFNDCSLADIPIIVGTWILTAERVCFDSSIPDAMFADEQATLIVEKQKNGVFYGQFLTVEDYYITGAIVGNKITINVEDVSVIHATLCGNTLAGAVADHNHDEGFCTMRFTGILDGGE